jgi:hypothetical protein
MKQAMALGILSEGNSVFLTGPAGSGKTYVLNEFVKWARANGKKVAVTASTGLAATHLGGNTIHSWAGIGIADELNKGQIESMSKSRKAQIQTSDILIIDEVSMLHDFRLDMVEKVCRLVRENDSPFGGLQVVLSGDFFQLPPINRDGSRQGDFIFDSFSWQELDPIVCYLEEQHRQNDDMLSEILTAFRENDLRRRHVEALMNRRLSTELPEGTTELYTHNINVDVINNAKLGAVEGEEHEFFMNSSGRKTGVATLKKSCLAPEVLKLKEGAFVMFVKNSQEQKFVNGTLGEVIGFEEDSGLPIVKIKNGKHVVADYETWELRDGEKKIANISQIPLRLAWAITIHKSQGMTLDSAHIDLSKAFVPGMGYVAISRVRTLDSLSLGGLNRTALTMNQRAQEIDKQLRKSSLRNDALYKTLESAWEKACAQKKLKKTKSGGTWAEKLAKMRLEYPNAYTPWTGQDDQKLLELNSKGKTIRQLSQQFGRHEGSIKARLEKLVL